MSERIADEKNRNNIISTLGKIPEKIPLELEFGEKTKMNGYYSQPVFYNTEQNDRVKAIILTPLDTSKKIPAIVACHQHAGQYQYGKCEPAGEGGDPMYFYGKELCLCGFAVICPDHLGFEERIPGDEELERRRINASFNERELFCRAISSGSTLQAKYVHDLSVAVDVLCECGFVDANRIGAIGHSLGGQETLWLTFYDKRIKAGVSSCGFATLESVFGCHIPHNFAMFTYGLMNCGDNMALIGDISSRGVAFMMTNGTDDYIFPLEGVKKVRDYALGCYESMGISEKYNCVIFKGDHSFPEKLREEAYQFLKNNLM